jgi:hypothetical protein
LVIRLDKARFLTTLILRQVTTIGMGFNKAYKSLVRDTDSVNTRLKSTISYSTM